MDDATMKYPTYKAASKLSLSVESQVAYQGRDISISSTDFGIHWHFGMSP